jgi:hypothetical protein
MLTAVEEFERLIRHERAAALIPFLLTLEKPDFGAARASLQKLKAELQTVVQLSENSWGTLATSTQSENLFLAGMVVLTRQDIRKGALSGGWILGPNPTAADTKAHFLTLVTALRPEWLTDWLLALQAQAEDWAVDYGLLRALEEARLIAYLPQLVARAVPHALQKWGWDLSQAPAIPARATEVIATQLRADYTLLTRDLPLIFDFDSAIHRVKARIQPPLPPKPETAKWAVGAEYPWQVWDRRYPPQQVSWSDILLSLVASGHLDRADLLTRCLGALRRDFRRPLLTWFRELFRALKPTFTERLAHQTELTELLAHPQALVVNFALDQLKDMHTEPGFNLAPLLHSAEGLLARPDLKTGLRTLVTGLARLPYRATGHAPAVASLLTTALAHPDTTVQERAAQGLAELLAAKKPLLTPTETTATLATLAQQAELLGAAARPALGSWLAPAAARAPRAEPAANYAPLAQFVPDISPATAIALVADWHELLFLTGQVLRPDEPAATERWLDGLLRLQGQLPAGYAAQLQPYLVRVVPALKKASAAEASALLAGPLALHGHEGLPLALLLGWASGFTTPRVATVQLATPTGPPPLLALEQHRYLLAETRLRTGTALPLLSTPTHQPHWVAPGALVEKLLAYQAAGTAPTAADLAVALARTAHAHPAEAAQALHRLPQLADAGLRELLTWFFSPAAQPLPALAPAGERQPAGIAATLAQALPELWAVAARTKAPAGTFPTLAASLGYDYAGIAQPLLTACEPVPRENRYPDPTQPGQEAVYRFVELSWRSGAAAPAPSPLLLYAPPAGKSQSGSWESNWLLVSDLPHLFSLLPNYPAPLYAQVLRCAAWADNLESSERDLLLRALRALLGPGPGLDAAATAVLASGLIHHTPQGRSLAQEVLLQAIAHGRLLPAPLAQDVAQRGG